MTSRTLTIPDGRIGHIRNTAKVGRSHGVWSVMALPAERDPEDYTMEPVTHQYVTLAALRAAITRGDCWIPAGHGSRWQ